MDDLARFCCHNPCCPDYGKREHGNRTVPMRYGPPQRRRRRCRTCQTRCSQRHGTPRFDSRLPEDKALSIREHLAEGGGVRQTGRLVQVNQNTVGRYRLLAADHARPLHAERVAFSPANPCGPVRRKRGLGGPESKARRRRRSRRRPPR